MALPDSLTLMGRPVLLMMPHAVDSRLIKLSHRSELAEVFTGARTVESDPAVPGAMHELTFAVKTRAETRFLEDFFDARLGAYEGFWMPTWQWEFEVVDYSESIGYHWIRHSGYSANLFPLGDAFRWLMFLRGDRYVIQKILSVTPDHPSGTTHERLAVSSQASTDEFELALEKPWTEAKGVRPLWLRYVRFADDEMDTEELGYESNLITVRVVERPGETPT